MRTISLRLDEATDATLRRLAERLGLTQTDVIKRALEELAREVHPTSHELAQQLGLIGGFASDRSSSIASSSERVKARLRDRRVHDEREPPPESPASARPVGVASRRRSP